MRHSLGLLFRVSLLRAGLSVLRTACILMQAPCILYRVYLISAQTGSTSSNVSLIFSFQYRRAATVDNGHIQTG